MPPVFFVFCLIFGVFNLFGKTKEIQLIFSRDLVFLNIPPVFFVFCLIFGVFNLFGKTKEIQLIFSRDLVFLNMPPVFFVFCLIFGDFNFFGKTKEIQLLLIEIQSFWTCHKFFLLFFQFLTVSKSSWFSLFFSTQASFFYIVQTR